MITKKPDKKRIAELWEWVYNFHADANLIEGWEQTEWDNQRDLLAILSEKATEPEMKEK